MNDKTRPVDPSKAADFKLERLKYVLSQQAFLNEHSHKYLTVFQSIVTAIVLAGVAVFMSWEKLSIPAEVARAAMRALELLLGATGAFVFVVIATNVASWWDYREEEVEILDTTVGKGFRKAPSLNGIWRWYEAWLMLLVLIVVVGSISYVEHSILPLIRNP